jgi:hypothetical protein
MRQQDTTWVLSLHENQSWNNNPGLFGLKIVWDLAWAVLVSALTVSLLDFQNSGSNSNHNFSGSFCRFG